MPAAAASSIGEMIAAALDRAVVGLLHLTALHRGIAAITDAPPLRIFGGDSVANVATRHWAHFVAVT